MDNDPGRHARIDAMLEHLGLTLDQAEKVLRRGIVRQAQEEFKDLANLADSAEVLLNVVFGWIIRYFGYTNVAIFLDSGDGGFVLGGYLKYTVSGCETFTESLSRVIVPRLNECSFVSVRGEEIVNSANLIPLIGKKVIAIGVMYSLEMLAAVVVFRDEEESPFTWQHEAILRSVPELLAVALVRLISDAESE